MAEASRGILPAFLRLWSGERESNPRHQPWQGCALSLSYLRNFYAPRILSGHHPEMAPIRISLPLKATKIGPFLLATADSYHCGTAVPGRNPACRTGAISGLASRYTEALPINLSRLLLPGAGNRAYHYHYPSRILDHKGPLLVGFVSGSESYEVVVSICVVDPVTAVSCRAQVIFFTTHVDPVSSPWCIWWRRWVLPPGP